MPVRGFGVIGAGRIPGSMNARPQLPGEMGTDFISYQAVFGSQKVDLSRFFIIPPRFHKPYRAAGLHSNDSHAALLTRKLGGGR